MNQRLLPDLKAQLKKLEQDAANVRGDGDCLMGYWIDSTTSKGHQYHRLRTWRNGKPAYIRSLKEDYSDVKAAIERGNRLSQIEREIVTVRADIQQIVDWANQIGLSIKNPFGDRDASVEWYTPAENIEIARQVLGQIDLDPASNPLAQTWIQADTFYTQNDDGLKQPWFGLVWCNPPYGSPEVRLMARKFLERGIAEYEAGTIQGAVFLLNRSGAKWYRLCLKQVTAVCQVYNRICFIDQDGKQQKSPRYYNDFVYLGTESARFKQVFSAIGDVHIVAPEHHQHSA